MSDKRLRLNHLSEVLAHTTGDVYKNLIVGGFRTIGPMDVPAMQAALDRTLAIHWELTGRLKEYWSRGRFKLAAVPVHESYATWEIADIEDGLSDETWFTQLIQVLEPSLNSDRDLFKGVPRGFHLFRMGNDIHIAAFFSHHGVSDFPGFEGFIRELLINYHELVIGEKPSWAGLPLSSFQKRKVIHANNLSSPIRSLIASDTRKLYLRGHSIPVGSGESEDRRQHVARRCLTPETTLQLGDRFKRIGRFVDLLLAAVHFAVDRWNEERNAHTSTIVTRLLASLPERYPNTGPPNALGAIYLSSESHHRRNFRILAERMANKRSRWIDNQLDLNDYRLGKLASEPFTVFPKVVRRLTEQRIVNWLIVPAITVSHIGTMSPKYSDGRPTWDSADTNVGRFQITDRMLFSYKMSGSEPLVLTTYFWNKRFNLIISAWANYYTQIETEALADLLIEQIVNAS